MDKTKYVVKKLLNSRLFRYFWIRAVTAVAALVVFCVVYTLILPASAATGEQATIEEGFYLEKTLTAAEVKTAGVTSEESADQKTLEQAVEEHKETQTGDTTSGDIMQGLESGAESHSMASDITDDSQNSQESSVDSGGMSGLDDTENELKSEDVQPSDTQNETDVESVTSQTETESTTAEETIPTSSGELTEAEGEGAEEQRDEEESVLISDELSVAEEEQALELTGKRKVRSAAAGLRAKAAGSGKIEVSKEMQYTDPSARLYSGKIMFAIVKDGDYVHDPYNESIPYVREMNIQGDGLNPSTVTFEGLEDGDYEVWEVHGDVNNDVIKRSYDGMLMNNGTVEIESIRVIANSNGEQSSSGLYNNNAHIEDGSTATMTFRNVFKPASGTTSFEANKVWMDRKEKMIQAPEDATVAFTLYKEVGGVTSSTDKVIILNGVADADGEINPWQAVFSNLPTMENGQQVRYKVRETSGWPDYYACKNKGKNLMKEEYLETSGGTIYNRNLLATVRIQKHFDIQPTKYSPEDWAEVLAKKQLSFELTNETTHKTWYFTLDDTFTQNGQEFYFDVVDMQAGHYVLKEYRYKGLISERKWTENGSWTEYERDINPGDNMDNPLFEMKVENHYIPGSDEPEGINVKALKVWDDLDDIDGIRPASVQVQLQAKVNDTDYSVPDITNPITLSEDNSWNTGNAWYDLPVEDENHNSIEYSVTELNVPKGYTCKTEVSDNGSDKSYTFTNTHRPQETGKIKIKKKVVAPDDVAFPGTYYFTVVDSEGKYWTEHGATGPEGHYTTIPISLTDKEGEKEINVPVGEYTVSEVRDGTEVPGCTLVVTGEGKITVAVDQSEEVLVTNTYKYESQSIDIVIKKVDQEDVAGTSTETLPGASFRLEKYTSAAYVDKDSQWPEPQIDDTEGTGVFNFEGLTEGYYKVVETKTPEGYVKISEDPKFSVVLNPTSGKLEVQFEDTDMVKYTATEGFRYGNSPGVELPSTGGRGTKLFTILGLAMMLGAGVMLFRRRSMI